MDASYDAIHTLGNVDFTRYLYFGVLVDGVATIKGNTITTTGPIIVPISIGKAGLVSGAGVLGLIGRLNPDATRTLNTDGSWNIKH
jgi:hypothetical protein